MHAVIAHLHIRGHTVDRRDRLTTPRIDLLTATAQNEIKSNDPRYRPYYDSVIPCYLTTSFYRGRLFDDLGIPQYY